ncbi:MAG: hypothetical protein IT426_01505 [Pirellulales bacterium]|nr:hypothetical protein [Pirellulales bacterium]
MSAGTRNHELGSQRPSARSLSGDQAERERLRIVRLDEAAVPAGNSSEGGARSPHLQRRHPAEYPAPARTSEPRETDEGPAAEPLPAREPGVDLAAIRPRDLDAGKLAAFLQDVPSAKRAGAQSAASAKAVVMPLANTDLREIFQADGICLVALPRETASMPTTEAGPEREVPPACSPVPPQQSSQMLDKTQQYLVDNWPKLPPNVQAAILNVIDAATGPEED